MEALDKHEIRHKPADDAAYLWEKYQTIPAKERKAFEKELGDRVGGEKKCIEEDDAMDKEIETLKKKLEILTLKESIRVMKKNGAMDVVVNTTESELDRRIEADVSDLSERSAEVTQLTIDEINVSPPLSPALSLDDTHALVPSQWRRPDLRDVENAFKKFSGESSTYDVRTFLEQFDEVMQLVNADETFKLLALRRSLVGAAEFFLMSTRKTTYTSLRLLLVNEFGHSRTTADIEAVLKMRKWKRGDEGLHRYILEMQTYYKQMGNERLTEKQVVDIIIRNMQLPQNEKKIVAQLNHHRWIEA